MSRSWRGLSKKKLSAADGQSEKIETPAEKEFKNRNRKEKKKDGPSSKLVRDKNCNIQNVILLYHVNYNNTSSL